MRLPPCTCKVFVFLGIAFVCGTARAASLSGSIVSQPQDSSDSSPLSRFDGTYHGMSKLVQTSISSSCEMGAPVDLDVKEGRFHFAWRPLQDAVVSISREGTYSTMLRGSFVSADKHMEVLPRIDGYTDGHVMVGEFGTRWCKYSYRLDRV
jgi:hypothetical protein